MRLLRSTSPRMVGERKAHAETRELLEDQEAKHCADMSLMREELRRSRALLQWCVSIFAGLAFLLGVLVGWLLTR